MTTMVRTGSDPASRRSGKGREQRRSTLRGQSHSPDLSKWYRHHLPPIHPGAFEFELALLRPGHKALRVDHLCDDLEWDDEQNVTTGSVSLHRPVPEDPTSLPIYRGQLLRCRVKWAGAKYELWTMRVLAPQTQVDTATVTATLQDDLALLKADTRDWIYRPTKTRKFAYTADEITRLVAKELGLKVGRLAKATHRQKIVMRNSSAYDVLFKAWLEEHKSSHKSYIIRIRNGRLEVVTMRRNPILYVLEQEIQTALITQQSGSKTPTTVLTGRATIGKGKGAKKISFTAFDRRVVSKLGYVHNHRNYGTVASHSELRGKVKRDLAKALELNHTVSITHSGIPFVLRGDGVEVRLPAEGYKGKQAFVFCTRANHTVQAAVYTSSFDFSARDPFLAEKRKESKAARTGSGKGTRFLVPASAEDDPPGTSASCGPLPADRRGYSVLSVSGHSSDAATAGQALTPGAVWPCGEDLVMTNPANGKSVVVPHVDNGAGSDSILPVVGIYPQTRADLGLDNSGSYHVIIQSVSGRTMKPARGSVA